MSLQPVADARVWLHVRRMYIFAGLLFLVNVLLGFMNMLTPVEEALPRWQLLTHLHAGTVGWITFSILATAIWFFTDQRSVSDGYASKVGFLAWFAFISFGGYIAAFGLAFNLGDPYYVMLPIFGIASMLTIWIGFGYTLMQMRSVPVVSTPHLLLAGALGIGSLGALMGVILGLGYAADFAPPGDDPIGQHAGVMDSYLLMGLAAMIEALVLGLNRHRTKGGITQTTFWVLTGIVTFVALFGNIGPLFPLGLLLVLAGLVTYLIRMAKYTFGTNPMKGDTNVGIFWAGLWLPIYVLLFASLIAMFIQEVTIPAWFWVIFAHTLFVGSATQLVIVMMSGLARHRPVARETMTGGLWLLNLGMLAFFAGSYAAGVSHGAALMGIGILAALFAAWGRLMGPGAPRATA